MSLLYMYTLKEDSLEIYDAIYLVIIYMYTVHKMFLNTGTSAKCVGSIKSEGRYLQNQTSEAVLILSDLYHMVL